MKNWKVLKIIQSRFDDHVFITCRWTFLLMVDSLCALEESREFDEKSQKKLFSKLCVMSRELNERSRQRQKKTVKKMWIHFQACFMSSCEKKNRSTLPPSSQVTLSLTQIFTFHFFMKFMNSSLTRSLVDFKHERRERANKVSKHEKATVSSWCLSFDDGKICCGGVAPCAPTRHSFLGWVIKIDEIKWISSISNRLHLTSQVMTDPLSLVLLRLPKITFHCFFFLSLISVKYSTAKWFFTFSFFFACHEKVA